MSWHLYEELSLHCHASRRLPTLVQQGAPLPVDQGSVKRLEMPINSETRLGGCGLEVAS